MNHALPRITYSNFKQSPSENSFLAYWPPGGSAISSKRSKCAVS